MQAQGKLDLALVDIERAIAIEPGNLAFRNNRSLLLRQTGDYMGAIEETITCRVAELQPILAKELVLGNRITMVRDHHTSYQYTDDTFCQPPDNTPYQYVSSIHPTSPLKPSY